ncbi:hypothetical protein [Lactococcus phage P1048]|uniref:Uncharacterized protein n=1 Tax=Lactococcus phage P1048 TaxID=2662295 RepID=A0A649V290_9CAUD|nr:hypothetical protein H1Z36_gp066 [Lactococcus phage P1048]QGJ84947.1 hypothetical protein [Lactococcus phage P1048]
MFMGLSSVKDAELSRKIVWSKKFHSQDFNCSDLDESDNVFGEKKNK